MKYSRFIHDTLIQKNGIHWNYYRGARNTRHILDDHYAEKFIQDYFNDGAKYLPFLLESAEAELLINRYLGAGHKDLALAFQDNVQHHLPYDRAIHTVSGFFLGLLIEHCLNGNRTLAIEGPHDFPFSYLWFLTFLYHDYGYCVAERKDFPNPFPTHAPLPDLASNNPQRISSMEYSALRKVKKALGINLSPFSQYPSFTYARHCELNPCAPSIGTILCKLTDRTNRISGSPKLALNNGTIIRGHRHLSSTITRYLNYCINERERVDHGIVGGLLFYDRMLKNYALAYVAHSKEYPNIPDLEDFCYNNRHFRAEQLKIFSYIADCILSHNIWKQPPEKRAVYEYYGLEQLLVENFCPISYENNPLLYILVVADTLEPLKVYQHVNPDLRTEEIIDAIELEYKPASKTLKISSRISKVDIAILHHKAKGLEEWTAVRCSPIHTDGFSLAL